VALLESQREREEISSEELLRDGTKTATGKIVVFQYLVVAVFIFLLAGF
jgi:hypothetical protein